MTDTTAALARFWAKVDKTDTCWLWTASRLTGGYGAFSWNGRTRGAHRFSYETFVGPIPAGLEPDHLCHQPPCVNPQHLQLVTKALNQQNRRGASANSKSGYRGVRQNGLHSWWALVQIGGQAYREGPFYTAEAADAAAVKMRNRLMTNNRVDRETKNVESSTRPGSALALSETHRD